MLNAQPPDTVGVIISRRRILKIKCHMLTCVLLKAKGVKIGEWENVPWLGQFISYLQIFNSKFSEPIIPLNPKAIRTFAKLSAYSIKS